MNIPNYTIINKLAENLSLNEFFTDGLRSSNDIYIISLIEHKDVFKV